jgi:DNA-binding NarL/FixJ family response regulator
MPPLPAAARLAVFVVEDSAIVRDHLIAVLHDIEGVRVVGSASTATAAAASINRLEPDVITLDLQLGSSTGWDVLRGVTCQPTVLVLTNFTDNWFRAKAEQFRVAAFFDKSTELEPFLESVRELRILASAEL